MDTNPDKHFFDLFLLVIGILVGVSFGLFLLANYVANQTQEVYVLQDSAYQQEVDKRIAPVGRVALKGETLEDAGQVAEVEPVAEKLTGIQVYNQACLACHGSGVGGAPKTGDTAAWAQRIAQDQATLRKHVLEGYQGSAGYMPPKGGRVDLSDGEILAAMTYILEQAR